MSKKEKNKIDIFKYFFYKEATGYKDLDVLKQHYVPSVFLSKFLEEETGSVKEMLKPRGDSTGNIEDKTNKIIKYPFERYSVSIELTPKNEFVGITEITLNKDFRSLQEKLRTDKFFNIEELDFEE